MTGTTAPERQADVIVVGAGPAGASTAYHLAQAGADVLLLEKSAFPRDKVCGDGLTPRAVRSLIGMGFDLDEPGWHKNEGLRIIGAGHRLEPLRVAQPVRGHRRAAPRPQARRMTRL